MRKLVISPQHGGFQVSDEAVKKMRELGCKKAQTTTIFGEVWKDNPDNGICQYKDSSRDFERDCPFLIQVIEEMGSKFCSGRYSKLKVVEIPEDVEWDIAEYDGFEWVEEKHRTWG